MFKISWKHLFVIFLASCLCIQASSWPPQTLQPGGNIYFVSPGGKDSNPGTQLLPWQTIQKAADTLAAGETVYILAGTYHEQVVPQNSGSPGNEIVYAAYPGQQVTIDGSSVSLIDDLDGLFNVSAKSHIRISGLRLINAGPYVNNAGVMIINSSFITVTNNSTYNTQSSGIGVWGSNHVMIENNTVDQAGGGGYQECITVANTDSFQIKNNRVLNCQKEGIDAKQGASNGKIFLNTVYRALHVGIYVDAWDSHTHDIEVFRNLVYDTLDNNAFVLASEMGGLLENIYVYNNIGYHNRYLGLVVSVNGPGDPSGARPMNGIYILNNTFYNNGWETWGGGIALDNPDAQNVVIRNNIVSQNLYFQLVVSAGVPAQNYTIDHNLIDGFRDTEGEIRGSDYVEGEARFVDAANANFRLQANSPAVDAGSSLYAPGSDFANISRPQDGNQDGDARYDIGAYELLNWRKCIFLPTLSR